MLAFFACLLLRLKGFIVFIFIVCMLFASMCAICVCQQLEPSNAWPPKPLISNVVVRQPAFELWNMLRFSWNWCHRRITLRTNCEKGFVSNFSATDACGCVACVEDSSWNIFDFIVIAVSVIDVCAVFCTMFDSYILVPPQQGTSKTWVLDDLKNYHFLHKWKW